MDHNMSAKARTLAPSTFNPDHYYNSDKNSIMTDYPPPTPAYNPYSTFHNPGSHPHYQSSSVSFGLEEPPYQQHQWHEEDNDSTVHLSSAAAPFSQQVSPIERARSTGIPTNHPGIRGQYDPHDVYQGRTTTPRIDTFQTRSPLSSGLAYDDQSEYSTASLPAYHPHSDNPYAVQGHYQSSHNWGNNGTGGGYGHAM